VPPPADLARPPSPAPPRRRPARALATSDLALALGRGLVRGLGASLRFREVRAPGADRLWASGEPGIYVLWHGRILMMPHFYGRRRRVHVLTSQSRDGEILARFVSGFGLGVVRGSSSRGGATALGALARILRERRGEIVIVPDGPRGPREVAQAGPVMLAKLTGVPVVPVGVGAWPRTLLRSWDAFMIPRPFARVVVAMAEPIRVPPDADAARIESARREMEASLIRVTAEADRAAGVPDVPAV